MEKKGSVSFVNMTPKEYSTLADKTSPSTKHIQNLVWAFLVGGAICTIGEVIFQCYSSAGLAELDARGAASITLIVVSALLTGFNVYGKIANFAGAGTVVPITGFANAIVSPAIEFKSEGHVMGIGAKMFSIAGPVIVFGITTSVVYGLVLWIFRLFL